MGVEAHRHGGQGAVAEPPGDLVPKAIHHLERPIPGNLRQEQSQHGALFEPAHRVGVALHGCHRAQDRDPRGPFRGIVAPVHEQHRERRVKPIRALPLPDERFPEYALAEDGTAHLHLSRWFGGRLGGRAHPELPISTSDLANNSHERFGHVC